MKLLPLLIMCCCLLGLAWSNDMVGTTRPFVRSRYSLRWRRTTTAIPETTAGRILAVPTSTEHPKVGTSTPTPEYDYYGV